MSSNSNSSFCYLKPSETEQLNNFYRMQELDELRGPLQHYELRPEGLLAIIADVPVLLPPELEEKFCGMIGCKIGILRCNGYRFRAL
jgi:hypothetical protein